MRVSVVSLTKFHSMITVLTEWHQTGHRLGLRDLDVRKFTVHRSSNGQLRQVAKESNSCGRDMTMALQIIELCYFLNEIQTSEIVKFQTPILH